MFDFIVNVKSGKGKGLKVINKITKYCDNHLINYNIHITEYKGHAIDIARALSKEGNKTIVAVGGDGTFHEVLNGITSFESCSLGFIPSGSGNDFAESCGIWKNPIKAFKDILDGKEKFIDYIQVADKKCLNVCGTGLDIEVLKHRIEKNCGYLPSLIYNLRHFEPYDIKATANGNTIECSCIMIGVCNGTQFGSGMKLSPLSLPDDGKLDVIIIKMPKAKIWWPLLIKFVKGKHMNLDITEHIKCEKVFIETSRPYIQLDGEIYKNLNFDCSIVKNGLRTFVTTAKKK